jgi:hypothetical protein
VKWRRKDDDEALYVRYMEGFGLLSDWNLLIAEQLDREAHYTLHDAMYRKALKDTMKKRGVTPFGS